MICCHHPSSPSLLYISDSRLSYALVYLRRLFALFIIDFFCVLTDLYSPNDMISLFFASHVFTFEVVICILSPFSNRAGRTCPWRTAMTSDFTSFLSCPVLLVFLVQRRSACSSTRLHVFWVIFPSRRFPFRLSPCSAYGSWATRNALKTTTGGFWTNVR